MVAWLKNKTYDWFFYFCRRSYPSEWQCKFSQRFKCVIHWWNIHPCVSIHGLQWCDTPVTYPKPCDSRATHVVNKIIYGQQAYFHFKHSKGSSSEKQDVGGSLQALVKSIPGFSIGESASLQLTREERKLSESLEVRFNGDFTFKNGIPTTFEGSIKAFKELSSKDKYFLLQPLTLLLCRYCGFFINYSFLNYLFINLFMNGYQG